MYLFSVWGFLFLIKIQFALYLSLGIIMYFVDLICDFKIDFSFLPTINFLIFKLPTSILFLFTLNFIYFTHLSKALKISSYRVLKPVLVFSFFVSHHFFSVCVLLKQTLTLLKFNNHTKKRIISSNFENSNLILCF